jgi:membrane protein implicated in regulation of membrane protease activity
MSKAAEGSVEDTVIYSERLWPSPWVWLLVLGAAAASIVTFAPIDVIIGFAAAAVIALVLVTLLILSTPRIVVTPTTLTVGRATIERRYLGAVSAYTGDEATEQRGTALNGLAYLCIRGWISPVVRIEVTDPEDRTPYWLASTRRPQQLTAALER